MPLVKVNTRERALFKAIPQQERRRQIPHSHHFFHSHRIVPMQHKHSPWFLVFALIVTTIALTTLTQESRAEDLSLKKLDQLKDLAEKLGATLPPMEEG